MNWSLLRRGLLWYSVLAAGASVAALVAVAGPGGAVGAFVAGLVTLLWAVGGGGEVRMSTAASNADATGTAGSVRDHEEAAPRSLPSDVRVFFYGVGLLVWGPVAGAVAVGVVPP